MKNQKSKQRWRSILIWTLWVLLLQFVLINISAALYADKLTHLHAPADNTRKKPPSANIVSKTWHLFTGPILYRRSLSGEPAFTFSTIILKTRKAIPIEAWYSKTDSVSKGTMILVHGLTGNKGLLLDEANAFRSFGYNVLLIDLRSHGNSGGGTTTIGYKESEEVRLAYDYIVQAGEKKIFLWGASMGAVAVIKALSDYQLHPEGIIIEMPFLSLQSHLKSQARFLGFPRQPFAFLTTFWIGIEQGFNGLGFKTTKYAKNINCPVLMQYGEKDELVLGYETDEIYGAIPGAHKKLVIYDEAGHESFLRKDPAGWKREVSVFLEQAPKAIF